MQLPASGIDTASSKLAFVMAVWSGGGGGRSRVIGRTGSTALRRPLTSPRFRHRWPLRRACAAGRHSLPLRAVMDAVSPGSSLAVPGTAYHLARWLAKEWDNYDQHVANPPFWAHIRVSYRPLPWSFLDGFSFYVESVYEYAPKLPYRTTIIKIVRNEHGQLETESYKLEGVEEFHMAAFDRTKLEQLVRTVNSATSQRCVKLPECCNAVFEWSTRDNLYRCRTRPGKQCIVRRGDRDSYVDASMTLSAERCTSWDVGRCPDTDEVLWGAAAGAFDFVVKNSWSHEVPSPPSGMNW